MDSLFNDTAHIRWNNWSECQQARAMRSFIPAPPQFKGSWVSRALQLLYFQGVMGFFPKAAHAPRSVLFSASTEIQKLPTVERISSWVSTTQGYAVGEELLVEKSEAESDKEFTSLEEALDYLNKGNPGRKNEKAMLRYNDAEWAVRGFVRDARGSLEVPDSSGHYPLITAVELGNREVVRLLLGVNANPNRVDSSGNSALHLAIQLKGKTTPIDLLLSAGADPNAVDSSGRTPLLAAVEAENRHAVIYLYLHNARMSKENEAVALKLALDEGDEEIISQLFHKETAVLLPLIEFLKSGMQTREVITRALAHGIMINGQDEEGTTAFHYACLLGQGSLARFLWQEGADPHLKDKMGNSSLDLLREGTKSMRALAEEIEKSKSSTSVKAVKTILDKSEKIEALPSDPKKYKKKLHQLKHAAKRGRLLNQEIRLFAALLKRDYALLNQLLKECPEEDSSMDLEDESLIEWAVALGDVEGVRQILASEQKRNPNRFKVALHMGFRCALKRGSREMIQLFLDHHVQIDQVLDHGLTPLSLAAQQGDVRTMRRILLLGADPNGCDLSKNTPFHYAAAAGQVKAMRVLLRRGANPKVYNRYGVNPLYKAIFHDQVEAVRLFIREKLSLEMSHGSFSTPLAMAAFFNKYEITQLFLEAGIGCELGTCDKIMAFKMLFPPRVLMDILPKPYEEGLALKLLAHSWELSGYAKVLHRWYPLEGGNSAYFSSIMLETLPLFVQRHPDVLKKQEITALSRMLREGEEHTKARDPAALAQKIRNNQTVQIHIATFGHAIEGLFWGDYFVINNKGRGSRRPIELHRICKSLVTPRAIQKIYDLVGDLTGVSYARWLDALPTTWGAASDTFGELVERSYQLPPNQTVDNCAWESIETSVYSLLALERFGTHYDPKKPPGAAAFDEVRDAFLSWLQFTQLYTIDRYLKWHEDPTIQRVIPVSRQVLQEVFGKAKATAMVIKDMESWLKQLEARYSTLVTVEECRKPKRPLTEMWHR